MTTPSQITHVLYDGQQGGTPDTRGRLLFRTSPDARATQTWMDGATILDTTLELRDAAGYVMRPPSRLRRDRAAGYRLSFTVQLLDEEHAASDKDGDGAGDRAGFSVIMLSHDLSGIELGFWPDRIWVQADGVAEPPAGTLFTHAESVACDTTRALISYTLEIVGDRYRLAGDGEAILAGRLRNYSSFEGPVNPYRTPNFVFLGDDTSSARAKIRLARVSLTVAISGSSPTTTIDA